METQPGHRDAQAAAHVVHPGQVPPHAQLATHWYQGPWSAIQHEVPLVPWSGPDQSRRAKGGKTSGVHGAAGNRAYEDTGMRLKTSVLDAGPARRMPGAGGRAAHRAGKPEGILTDLITYACPPGGLFIDPFAASCPSLRVARETGRRAIGIEADEAQAEQAARWLSQMALEAS